MNRWYFWVLAPIMVATAIFIPATVDPPSVVGVVVSYAFSLMLLLATLGLANPRRFRWALRGVAAIILIAGVSYFLSELNDWRAGKSLGAFGSRSSSSLWNAGFFLLLFGIPALRYLLSSQSGSILDVIAAPEVLDDAEADPDEQDRLRTLPPPR